jgi:hypothetical protein
VQWNNELKTGLAIDQASRHEMSRNVAFMWFKGIAYNLFNWFRLVLLPAGASGCEIATISWNLNLIQAFSPVHAGLILVLPFLHTFQPATESLDFRRLK